MSLLHNPAGITQERVVHLAEEIWARSTRERETLVAAYVRQNPDVPIGEIVLIEQRDGNRITWSVARRQRRNETDG